MKSLSIVLALNFGLLAMAHAEKIQLKIGDTVVTNGGDLAECAPRKCVVNFVYVGKTFELKTPNDKVYGAYSSRETALEKAKTLIDTKVCDAVEIGTTE